MAMNPYDNDFFRVYYPQTGGAAALTFYKSNVYRQRGRGFGGFFGSLFKRLIPLAKQYVLPHAKTGLMNVANDVLNNNKSLVDSLKSNSIDTLKAVGKDILAQSGSGFSRKRKASKVENNSRKCQKKTKVNHGRAKAKNQKQKENNKQSKTKKRTKTQIRTLFSQ
jgi:hypothetical protein